jgi:NAD(P)-dependent dehydrogenase (short-subunit alcohol dehydrogenase family)
MSNLASEEARPRAPLFDLSGKRIVVIGGKKAIGLGVAKAALAMGAAVTIGSRRDVSAEERPDLAAFGQMVLDIRDEAAVQAAFEAIGRFDHLVVTAGPELSAWGSFKDPNMSGVRSCLEGKFLGTWACARHAAPRLRAGGSMTFLTGGPGPGRRSAWRQSRRPSRPSMYCRSRSPWSSLPSASTRSGPGSSTPILGRPTSATVEEIRAKVRARFPARRLGTAADIGHAAVFLMTNPYVTGTLLEVSGGELLRPDRARGRDG